MRMLSRESLKFEAFEHGLTEELLIQQEFEIVSRFEVRVSWIYLFREGLLCCSLNQLFSGLFFSSEFFTFFSTLEMFVSAGVPRAAFDGIQRFSLIYSPNSP